MTKEELAGLLDGRESGDEITEAEEKAAKESMLIVLFGASDDLAEFLGCLSDEASCYDGGTILIDENLSIIESDHECDCEFCGHKSLAKNAHKIEAIWDRDGISWQYKTDIPHATFNVMEDGEVYCRGIVFNASDITGGK